MYIYTHTHIVIIDRVIEEFEEEGKVLRCVVLAQRLLEPEILTSQCPHTYTCAKSLKRVLFENVHEVCKPGAVFNEERAPVPVVAAPQPVLSHGLGPHGRSALTLLGTPPLLCRSRYRRRHRLHPPHVPGALARCNEG